VRKTEDAVWDMAEFFVLRGLRRRGIGARAAQLAFQQFPGMWRVRVMKANRDARNFWERTIRGIGPDGIEAGQATQNGAEWTVFSFSSRSR
jgi:predicted acetyltransferase